MSAEEYLKRVGLIQSPQISQERAIKHMESYAREYHAKEMERKLLKSEQHIEETFMVCGTMSNSKQEEVMDVKRGAKWLLNHLKEDEG